MQKTVSLSMQELSPVITQCVSGGGEVIMTVAGNSMRPFIKDRRDQVVLVRADGDRLKVGDVPLYVRRNGKYVLHRIVEIKDGAYTMLGDAQVTKEYGIQPDQIVALAKAFIRKGKRYECDSKKYRRYVEFWMGVLPLRKLYFKLYRFGARIYRKLVRILKIKA